MHPDENKIMSTTKPSREENLNKLVKVFVDNGQNEEAAELIGIDSDVKIDEKTIQQLITNCTSTLYGLPTFKKIIKEATGRDPEKAELEMRIETQLRKDQINDAWDTAKEIGRELTPVEIDKFIREKKIQSLSALRPEIAAKAPPKTIHNILGGQMVALVKNNNLSEAVKLAELQMANYPELITQLLSCLSFYKPAKNEVPKIFELVEKVQPAAKELDHLVAWLASFGDIKSMKKAAKLAGRKLTDDEITLLVSHYCG
jgi:hypothetical protein